MRHLRDILKVDPFLRRPVHCVSGALTCSSALSALTICCTFLYGRYKTSTSLSFSHSIVRAFVEYGDEE